MLLTPIPLLNILNAFDQNRACASLLPGAVSLQAKEEVTGFWSTLNVATGWENEGASLTGV